MQKSIHRCKSSNDRVARTHAHTHTQQDDLVNLLLKNKDLGLKHLPEKGQCIRNTYCFRITFNTYLFSRIRGSEVGTSCTFRGSNFGTGKIFCSPKKRPDRSGVHYSSHTRSNGVFSREYSSRGMKMTAHFRLQLRLTVRELYRSPLPLRALPAWTGTTLFFNFLKLFSKLKTVMSSPITRIL